MGEKAKKDWVALDKYGKNASKWVMCLYLNMPSSEHQLYVRHYIIHLYYLY